MVQTNSKFETTSSWLSRPTDLILHTWPSPLSSAFFKASRIWEPASQLKVILPLAFFENDPWDSNSNMDTGLCCSLMADIRSAPVLNSAAMPCTAQNMERKGFWLIHLNLTPLIQQSWSIEITRTPVNQAAGNLKSKYQLIFEGDIFGRLIESKIRIYGEAWSVKREAWSVNREAWSVKREVWSEI